jgi:hypothetical protein
MDQSRDPLALRLATIRVQLDQPPGVGLGVLRLPILDPVSDELERLLESPLGDAALAEAVTPDVIAEVRGLVEVLLTEMLGMTSEMVPRRARLIEILRRIEGGRLPAEAVDPGDPFGVELRSMLESDGELQLALGRLHPLTQRATSPLPTSRWLRDASELAEGPEAASLSDATRRTLAALVRAPIESRPDLLIGGVRLVNQRFARGLLWYASIAINDSAEILGAVGLRMGTSGRSHAVVRDLALANASAGLLGRSPDPGAAAALSSMRLEVTNRNVLKQVDRALDALATERHVSIEDLIDLSLPTFGLDERGHVAIPVGSSSAVLRPSEDGTVFVHWRLPDGSESADPAPGVDSEDPGGFADVERLKKMIEGALAEERRRLEQRLGSMRSWPISVWRVRFGDHPLAAPLARRLVWVIDRGSSADTSALPDGDGWIGVDERPVGNLPDSTRLRLWHPAEAGESEIAAWRATLARRAVRQPIRQADREVFLQAPDSATSNADVRFLGQVVRHAPLRALLRERGWAVPALGPWDQGDEATGWRVFDDGLRAEIRYQAPERVATGERIEHARLIAVRFVRTDAADTAPAAEATSVPIASVPPRSFSEAIRDVSLAVAVAGEEPSA